MPPEGMDDEHGRGLRHRLDDQTPGMTGRLGK
jgi:hypothetical protein